MSLAASRHRKGVTPAGYTFLLFVVLVSHGTAANLFGQCAEWSRVSDRPPEIAPTILEVIYDGARRVSIGMAESRNIDNRLPVLLYQFSGGEWRPIQAPPTTNSTTFRTDFGACYNSARQTIMIFGGYSLGGSRFDFWEWDGGRWRLIQDEIEHPVPWKGRFAENKLVYDPGRDRVILLTPPGREINQTWEWNGSRWEQGPDLGPIGTGSIGGFGTWSHDIAFTFDIARGRGFLCAKSWSSDIEQVWEYLPGETAAKSRWQQVAIAGPAYKAYAGMSLIYDPYRRQVVRHGGYRREVQGVEYNRETAVWNPAASTWQPVTAGPDQRLGERVWFDPGVDEIFLYGGAPANASDLSWRLIRREPGWVVDLDAKADWCEGKPGILAVTVAGSGLGVQWYKNGEPIEGATSTLLFVNSVTPASAGIYQAFASNDCGEIASRACRVSVPVRPSIKSLPVWDHVVCRGDNIVIKAPEYEGTLPIDVQLQRKNGEFWDPLDLPYNVFAGREVFTIRNAKDSDTGLYRFALSNGCGKVISMEFFIQVGLGITSQPANTTADVCESAALRVDAVGVPPLHFQWRLDETVLTNNAYFAGGTGPELLIQPVLYAHEGSYDVIVTDSCSPPNVLTSRVAKLTVKPGPEWVLRATSGPAARSGHSLTYDPVRRVTTLFGGWNTDPQKQFVPFNDLWEWDGARWLQRMPNSQSGGWTRSDAGYWQLDYQNGPVARTQHGMAYDSGRGRLVLFGGQTRDPGGSQVFLNDTWEWDGLSWFLAAAAATVGPTPRINSAMAYDTSRGVTVMTGGFLNGPDATSGGVWEWNGETWKLQSPTKGPAKNYSQDIGAMVFDSFRKKILFGPTIGEVHPWAFWTWNGQEWNAIPPSGSLPFLYLQYGDMTYDTYRRRAVHFGGLFGPPANHTVTFDGISWEVLSAKTAPSGRSSLAIAYDSARHAVVLFGGETGNQLFNGETWELIPLDTPLINEQPPSQYRKSGESAALTVKTVPPNVTYRWFKNGQPLADQAGILGSATAALQILNVTAADEGTYKAVIYNKCGFTESAPAILTLNPGLQVFSGANTASLLWTDPQVILEQADTHSGPWTPVPGASAPFNPAAFGPAKFFRLRPL